MKNNKRVIAAVMLGASVSAFVLMIAQNDRVRLEEGTEIQPLKPVQAEENNAPEGMLTVPVKDGTVRQSQQDNSGEHREHELEPITQQLAVVAEVYAAEVQYPPYSKPISETNLSYLEPNYYSVVEVPVLDGAETASLSLQKYRNFYPEPITVSLNTGLAVNNIQYVFFDPTTKEVLASEQTELKSLSIMPNKSWPQEVRVKATIDFDLGTDILTADFTFFVPAAYLTSVGAPSSQGADMVIPLNLDVKQAGIYRVRANLLTREGKVIAALNNKSKLGEGEQVLTLKAHSSVLAQTDGHYQLRHWVIEKMSGYPGEKASYGVSMQDAMPLAPFEPSILSQEPYTLSPEEQQRLEFLRQAAKQ